MFLSILQQSRWWCPMCGYDGAWGGLMMFGMTFFWVFVIALLIWLAYRATQGSRQPDAPPTGPIGDPEATLKARYASGEIDRETFLRMLEDLKSSSDSP